MKSMQCDLCEKSFSADSFDQWFIQMQDHYQKDHADFMKQAQSKTKEEGMQWMQTMKDRFDSM